MAKDPVLIDSNPGRSAQTYGIARELGTDPELIHAPSVGVIGNKGDSQCYIGVQRKAEAIHEALRARIGSRGWRNSNALGAAGVHRCDVRRYAQRYPRNALLLDRQGSNA